MGRAGGYLVAIAATAVALLARLALAEWLQGEAPLLLFGLAVAAAGWYSGWRAGLFATALGGAAGFAFFIDRSGWQVRHSGDAFRLLVYAVAGVMLSGLSGALRAARLRAAERGRQVEQEAAAREKAEQHVWSVVRQLQLVTDGAPVLIAHCDCEHRFKFVNVPYAERFGLRPQDIVGKLIPEVIGARAYEAIRSHVEAALTGHSVEFEMEVPYHLIGNRWMLIRYNPERDAGGAVVGYVAINLDVTDRKRAQDELRRSEERLRLAQSAGGVGVWEWDAGARRGYWSSAMWRIHGVEPAGDEGPPWERWLSWLHPEDRDRLRTEFEGLLAVGSDFRTEYRLDRPDGEVRWVEMAGQVERDEAGRPVGLVGVTVDITARKEAARKKDDFIATLAHELRNPLAPIRNAVAVLQTRDSGDTELGWCRDVIERQVGQMAHLLEDLLDVSRIARNKLTLRRVPVDLAAVVQSAAQSSRALMEAAGHRLAVTLPAESVPLEADPVRLEQVLTNLLSNAAKYTEPGGRIWLTAERNGEQAVVMVRDTGIGIAAEHLPRLFEMFSQAAPALERSQGGLGVGLALVRGLVEMHAGSVTADSAGPGQGSTFVVRLPVAAVAPAAAEPPGSGAPPAAVRRRVLVVDDLPDNAESMALLLGVMGNEVRTAYDGEEAVEAAEQFRPDVVLMDIGMPRLNGYEACRRIRALDWAKDVVLIAQTGWGQEEDRRRAREAGFDHHLVKPVDPADLVRLLAEVRPL